MARSMREQYQEIKTFESPVANITFDTNTASRPVDTFSTRATKRVLLVDEPDQQQDGDLEFRRAVLHLLLYGVITGCAIGLVGELLVLLQHDRHLPRRACRHLHALRLSRMGDGERRRSLPRWRSSCR